MSNALTLVWGAFFAHNVLWWNWPSGKSFSCIKLTESMALAVDGNLLFYTGLSGAGVELCVGYRCGFHLQLFLHSAAQRRVHHVTQVPVIVKVSLRLHPQWGCETASVPQEQVCSECYNTTLPLYNYIASSKIPAPYLHNLVWSGPQRRTEHFAHNRAKLVCVSVSEMQTGVRRAYGQLTISILIFFMEE